VWRARKANAEIVEVDLKSAVMQIANGRGMRCRFLRIAKIGGSNTSMVTCPRSMPAAPTPQTRRRIKSGWLSSLGDSLKATPMSPNPARLRFRFSVRAAVIDYKSRAPMSPNSLTIGWNSSGQITPSTG